MTSPIGSSILIQVVGLDNNRLSSDQILGKVLGLIFEILPCLWAVNAIHPDHFLILRVGQYREGIAIGDMDNFGLKGGGSVAESDLNK